MGWRIPADAERPGRLFCREGRGRGFLGRHRILCGNALDAADFAALMGEERAGSRRWRPISEFRQRRAWVVQNGTVIEVPASAVAIGDVVVVYHGETKLGTRLTSPYTAHASTSKPAETSRVTW